MCAKMAFRVQIAHNIKQFISDLTNVPFIDSPSFPNALSMLLLSGFPGSPPKQTTCTQVMQSHVWVFLKFLFFSPLFDT